MSNDLHPYQPPRWALYLCLLIFVGLVVAVYVIGTATRVS